MAKQTKLIAKSTRTETKVREPAAQVAAAPKTKLGQLEGMLRRPAGATIVQLAKALSWQAHSVRGAMSGALKKIHV